MHNTVPLSVCLVFVVALLESIAGVSPAFAQTPTLLDNEISIRGVVQVPANTIRVVEDPLSDDLFVLKSNGDVFRVNVTANTRTTIYDTSDHGLGGANVMGLAAAPDGTVYVLATIRSDTSSFFRIVRGVPGASDAQRTGRHSPSLSNTLVPPINSTTLRTVLSSAPTDNTCSPTAVQDLITAKYRTGTARLRATLASFQ